MSGPGPGSVAVNQFSEAENSSANIREAPESLRKLLVERDVTPPREDSEQKKIADAVFKINEQATEKEKANQKLDASQRLQLAEYYVDRAITLIKPTDLTGEQTSQSDVDQRYLLAVSLINTLDVIISAKELGADYQPHLNKMLKVPGCVKYLDPKKGLTEAGKKLLVENDLCRPNSTIFGRISNILDDPSQKNKKQGLSTEQSGQRFSPYPSNSPRSESVLGGSERSSHVQPQNNVGGPIRG